MPGKLCIIDNIGLHRRTELLLSQAVALLIIRNVVALQGFEPYWTFCLYNKTLLKRRFGQFSHSSMLVSYDTLRALLEAFHLQRVTELPSSTNTLSWQYYLPGYNHLLYSLALLLCRQYKNHLPDFIQSSSISISSGVNFLKREDLMRLLHPQFPE